MEEITTKYRNNAHKQRVKIRSIVAFIDNEKKNKITQQNNMLRLFEILLYYKLI